MSQHRSADGARFGEHQTEGLGNHEIGAEGAQRSARLGDDTRVRQRAQPLDPVEALRRQILVAGVADTQAQLRHAPAQRAERIERELESLVGRGEEHQLVGIDGRAVGHQAVIDRVVDAVHGEALAAADARHGRGDSLPLVFRHAHDLRLQAAQRVRGSQEPARARRARLDAIVQPQPRAGARLQRRDPGERPRIAQHHHVADGLEVPRCAVTPRILAAVVLADPGVEAFRDAYHARLGAGEPRGAQAVGVVRARTQRIEEQHRQHARLAWPEAVL